MEPDALEPNASEPQTQKPSADAAYDIVSINLPPYYVISYCNMIGFEHPEDRPWREVTRDSPFFQQELLSCSCFAVSRIGSRWSQLQAFQAIRLFMHRCFFRDNGKITFYRIGQCPACHTIYWSEDN